MNYVNTCRWFGGNVFILTKECVYLPVKREYTRSYSKYGCAIVWKG